MSIVDAIKIRYLTIFNTKEVCCFCIDIFKILIIICLYKNYAVHHFVIYSIYLNDIHVTLGEVYLK